MLEIRKPATIQIVAYEDEARQTEVASLELPYRAEKTSARFKNKFSSGNSVGARSGDLQFQRVESAEIRLTLLLGSVMYDDVVSYATGKTATKAIQELMRVMYTMNGNSHEPNHLVLMYGDMPLVDGPPSGFLCRLVEMELENKHVRFDGAVLAAEARCVFVESMSRDERSKRIKKGSPDVAHTRLIRRGDTLAAASRSIYGSPRYVVELAKANDLNHLRSLEPGSTLILPPLGD